MPSMSRRPLAWAAAVCAVLTFASGCSSTPAPDDSDPAQSPAAPEDLTPQSGRPEPDPSTPAPQGSVTEANLPNEALDWAGTPLEPAAETLPTDEQFSDCQQFTLASLGPDATHAKAYGDPEGDPSAHVVVMSFPDAETAEGARTEVRRWLDTCEEILTNNGAQPPVEHAVTGHEIPGENGQNTLDQWNWTAEAGPHAESQLIVLQEDRMALVMIDSAPETWSTEPGAEDAHPALALIPQVTEALTS